MTARRALVVLLCSASVAACGGGDSVSSHLATDAGSRPDAAAEHDDARPNDSAADAPAHAAPDARRPSDTGSDALAVAPLAATPNQWNWTYIPGSLCADGTQTGFAVNPAPSPSTDVLLFLEGGGACWDATSCWGPASTAFYVATGYGQTEFETDPQVTAIYLLDRTSANNPFAKMNLVYVPYCTGDVFAGSNVTDLDYLGVTHSTHFVGYDNLTLYLRYVAATFEGTSRVWLAGDSAGGFGAALNFEHVQGALPGARVDVLDDSGQPIEPAPGLWKTWTTAWNMQLPSGCAGCQADPGAFVAYYSAKYPSQRFGLISYQYDVVISPFMDLTLTQFNTELYALAANMDAGWVNGHYFVIPGSSHVGLLAPSAALMTWVQAMVSDDPSWASSKP